MNVKPMLGDWEIPRIASINTLERRAFVEMPVPGRVGSLFQDLNTTPTRIAISGSLYGDEARNAFLEELRGKFRQGVPVTFVADIVTATEVQYVIIETLRFQESGTKPDQIDYFMVLQESPPRRLHRTHWAVWTLVSSTRPGIFSTQSPARWM